MFGLASRFSRWPRRIVPLPEFAHSGPVKDAFDTAAQARRCFGLVDPDRAEYLHGQVSADCGKGQRIHQRTCVSCKGILPLAGMLGALPAAAMGVNVCQCALIESDALGLVQRVRGFREVAFGQRVLTFLERETAFARLPTMPAAGRSDPYVFLKSSFLHENHLFQANIVLILKFHQK